MKKKYFILFSFFVGILTSSCHSSTTENSDSAPEVRTPVSVTSVSKTDLSEYIWLNATSGFLQQNFVKSNLNGYIQKCTISFGDFVHKGQTLFVLKTKEANAIGNAVNRLDSSFRFSGVNVVRSDVSGFVIQLDHHAGDYVQDGEQLAVISDAKSFVFMMNVPYQDRSYVSAGTQVPVILPDSETLSGIISAPMPVIDSVTQTQAYAIRVNARHSIPPNLIAKVRILKTSVSSAQTLPKITVLSDETQTAHWVMKLINDSTAIKVPVETGIEKGDTIQIVSPQFSATDKILSGGNYGLADTALVTVNKQ